MLIFFFSLFYYLTNVGGESNWGRECVVVFLKTREGGGGVKKGYKLFGGVRMGGE